MNGIGSGFGTDDEGAPKGLAEQFDWQLDHGVAPPRFVAGVAGKRSSAYWAITSTLAGSNEALNVAILDSSGNQISTFGGGTTFDEGDAIDTTSQGTLMIGADGVAGTARVIRTNSSGQTDIRPLTSSDVVSAAQSGTWVLGANSGVDIGDVTINNASGAAAVNIQDGGNTITVDATNLDIRDIDAATDDITVFGSQSVALQQKITTNDLIVTLDGETVAATQSGTWNITNISGTISLPTGASTLAEQQTQTTALQLIDDTVATLGTTTYTETTTKGLTIGAVRRDADTTLVGTTNEIGPLQMDANGRLKVEIFDGGDSHTVDGTVAATQSGTWNIGTVTTVTTVSALGAGTTGPMKAEDVASAAGDQGIAAMAIRRDTPVADDNTSADGDYTFLKLDNYGSQWSTPFGGVFPTFGQTSTTNTTATQINSASTKIRRIYIKALDGNIETIYIGGSGVTTSTGHPLRPGEDMLFSGYSTVSQWYLIKSNSASQGVSYEYS